MRPRLPRLPALLAGWPRRAAAGLCFALALLSALSPTRSSTSPASASVPAGMVRTSASVYADATSFLRRGDRIDLVEPLGDPGLQTTPRTATVVARDVRVLDIRSGSGLAAQSSTAQVLVAAPPDVATAIAAHQGGQVLAVTTAPP